MTPRRAAVDRFLRFALKAVSVAAGLALLWRAARWVSWPELETLLRRSGPALLAVLLVYPVNQLFFTLGFRRLLPPASRRGLWRLYGARIAGEALNSVTPFVDVGGEPLKVYLIRKSGAASIAEAVTAVCMSRVAYVLSEILAILILLPAVWRGPFARVGWVLALGAVFSCVYAALLIAAQTRGAIRAVPRILDGLKKRGLDSKEEPDVWKRVDGELRGFYARHPADFAVCVFWNTLGWVTGLFEVWVVFVLLKIPAGLLEAYVLQMCLEATKSLSFYIPGNVGSQELGLAYAAEQLGHSTADGIALSVMKRFRHFFWFAAGMLVWARWPRLEKKPLERKPLQNAG